MASVASNYLPPHTATPTKKRPFSEYGSGSTGKRINLAPKYSASMSKSHAVTPKPAIELTGLEGILQLDQPFVEATKATEDDEARHSVRESTKSSHRDSVIEKRHLASMIQASAEGMPGSGRGLQNLTGALCYRHSLFQGLLHTPKFVHWLVDFHKPKDCVADNSGDCVSCNMRLLVMNYWAEPGKKRPISTCLRNIHELFTYLNWDPKSYIGHGDPDEQLAWMLGIMRSEMPSNIFNYFDAFHNLILESQIKCERCSYVSKTPGNNERHLSLPINVNGGSRQLTSLIEAYMAEVVEGYKCEKCKHESAKHRIHKISYAPDVLLIQLKRFKLDGKKDRTVVGYGPRLDLSPHSSNPSLGPLNYDLTAVISHTGRLEFGHYNCVAKNPEAGEWYVYDDNDSAPCSIKEALNPASLCQDYQGGWTPYLLFYQRNQASMPPP